MRYVSLRLLLPDHRLVEPACLLLLAALLLVGCSKPVVTLAPRPTLPAALWQCPPQPPLPADLADDITFFEWVGDVLDAGKACRAQLAIARKAVEGTANARGPRNAP